MKDAPRTIPRGIALAILLTAIVYVAIAATVLGLIGPDQVAASKAPLLDAAKHVMGRFAAPVILGAACVSILKTMNATTLVYSRALFAMGRAGALPPIFASIHPRFGTPQGALLFAYITVMLGLFLPQSLTFLLLAVNIPTVLKYMASSLCAVVVARRHADLYASSGTHLSRTTIVVLGWLAVLAGAAILIAGLGDDLRPYELIGAWAVIGFAVWFFYARRNEAVSAPPSAT